MIKHIVVISREGQIVVVMFHHDVIIVYFRDNVMRSSLNR